LDRFVILGMGGPLTTVKSPLPLIKMFTGFFFRVFLEFSSTVLYKKWVLMPVNLPEARSNMKEYSIAVFPGCIGSSDCTHIVTERCQYNLKNNHLGPKNSLTTRTFNLMCNHSR
jgi:hypothetical protein